MQDRDPHNADGQWKSYDVRGHLTLEAAIRYRLRAAGTGRVRLTDRDGTPIVELQVNDDSQSVEFSLGAVTNGVQTPTHELLAQHYGDAEALHWSVRVATLDESIHAELDRGDEELAERAQRPGAQR